MLADIRYFRSIFTTYTDISRYRYLANTNDHTLHFLLTFTNGATYELKWIPLPIHQTCPTHPGQSAIANTLWFADGLDFAIFAYNCRDSRLGLFRAWLLPLATVGNRRVPSAFQI